MTSTETLKIKAASFDFCGDVLKILHEISYGLECCQDGEKIKAEIPERIKAIKKFCNEAENRLSDLIVETECRYDGDIIQDEFINQIKAIKRLCERAMKNKMTAEF